MGLYDLPAMINYVLDTTGRSTLSYVGHSEGTTQAFVGFSENQEVAKLVDYFGALAPVAWTGHATAELFVALAKLKVDEIFLNLGFTSFLPHTELLETLLANVVCTNLDELCNSAIGLIAGPSDNLNATRIPVYLSQTPAGTSVQNMAHFDPPAFPIGDMVYPRTGFYIGATDTFATSTDIEQLRSGLPSGTIVHEQTTDAFSHLDFSWAQNANELVYQDLLAQLQKYAGVGY